MSLNFTCLHRPPHTLCVCQLLMVLLTFDRQLSHRRITSFMSALPSISIVQPELRTTLSIQTLQCRREDETEVAQLWICHVAVGHTLCASASAERRCSAEQSEVHLSRGVNASKEKCGKRDASKHLCRRARGDVSEVLC